MSPSPREFHEFAEECLRWAEQTDDKEERELLIDLSKQWTQAAVAFEQSIGQSPWWHDNRAPVLKVADAR